MFANSSQTSCDPDPNSSRDKCTRNGGHGNFTPKVVAETADLNNQDDYASAHRADKANQNDNVKFESSTVESSSSAVKYSGSTKSWLASHSLVLFIVSSLVFLFLVSSFLGFFFPVSRSLLVNDHPTAFTTQYLHSNDTDTFLSSLMLTFRVTTLKVIASGCIFATITLLTPFAHKETYQQVLAIATSHKAALKNRLSVRLPVNHSVVYALLAMSQISPVTSERNNYSANDLGQGICTFADEPVKYDQCFELPIFEPDVCPIAAPIMPTYPLHFSPLIFPFILHTTSKEDLVSLNHKDYHFSTPYAKDDIVIFHAGVISMDKLIVGLFKMACLQAALIESTVKQVKPATIILLAAFMGKLSSVLRAVVYYLSSKDENLDNMEAEGNCHPISTDQITSYEVNCVAVMEEGSGNDNSSHERAFCDTSDDESEDSLDINPQASSEAITHQLSRYPPDEPMPLVTNVKPVTADNNEDSLLVNGQSALSILNQQPAAVANEEARFDKNGEPGTGEDWVDNPVMIEIIQPSFIYKTCKPPYGNVAVLVEKGPKQDAVYRYYFEDYGTPDKCCPDSGLSLSPVVS